MDIFESSEDRLLYLRLLKKSAAKHGLAFVCWCLMDNHVHLITVPATAASLARGIGDAHKAYTSIVNKRKGVRGYLFQGRFFSAPLDPPHLKAAAAYVLDNPVRAGMVGHAHDYPWSSARFHAGSRKTDPLIEVPPEELDPPIDLSDLPQACPGEMNMIRRGTRSGRPIGDERFVRFAERITGRNLRKRKPGPKAHKAPDGRNG